MEKGAVTGKGAVPGKGAATGKGGPGKGRTGSGPGDEGGSFWRTHRRELTFVALFLVLLAGSFTLLSVSWVDQHAVVPFTAAVAGASGQILQVLGQNIERQGTVILSDRFSVNIENGCNGVEAMLIFIAAVLAFPAPWKARLWGVVLGLVAIQAVNLIRVVGLYLTGAYLPEYFDTTHTVIGQTVVILSSVVLWLVWAQRLARDDSPPPAAEA